ncbi:MAG TPA: 7-cyano-7-deazaguanine synthase [Vicinamibacterales bacterium]|jgi:7-cyano-7-deazaguanine synthase|nr:7-cyano-7-deazaguanine synthase [Vicinamibacterales bacterium]
MVAQTLVLCSAGLDSAVLVALEAQTSEVTPAYIAVGLAWEAAERAALDALMKTKLFSGRVRPPVILSFDMHDVYPPSHWAIRGIPPGYDTPDEDVYIDGRNVVLLAKGAVYAARVGIGRIALGPLAGNPFPDATPRFFSTMAKALSHGLDRPIDIATPLVTKRKAEVIKLGIELGVPLGQTLSCMNPGDGGRHCGGCSKCRERHDAFVEAGVPDPTDYVIHRP